MNWKHNNRNCRSTISSTETLIIIIFVEFNKPILFLVWKMFLFITLSTPTIDSPTRRDKTFFFFWKFTKNWNEKKEMVKTIFLYGLRAFISLFSQTVFIHYLCKSDDITSNENRVLHKLYILLIPNKVSVFSEKETTPVKRTPKWKPIQQKNVLLFLFFIISVQVTTRKTFNSLPRH